MLVALPRSPERLRPDRHPEAARARRATRSCSACPQRVSSRTPRLPRLAPSRSRGCGSRCRSMRRIWRGRCATQDPAAPVHRTTIDPLLQRQVEALLRREAAALDPQATLAALVVDNRDRRVIAYVGNADFCRGAPRHDRHGAGGALAGLGAEAVHLCDGVRPADHPSRNRARRPAAPFRRLRARRFRRAFPGRGQRAPRRCNIR